MCVAGITLGEDGTLTIERVKKDDEGLYECIAKNDEGSAKASAVVTVLGKSHRQPHILSTLHSGAATCTILVSQSKVLCAYVQSKHLLTSTNSSGLTSA